MMITAIKMKITAIKERNPLTEGIRACAYKVHSQNKSCQARRLTV
ncbi:MAG: hypothetical protein ABIG31_05515 [Candidatus Omnitrophota bacterium]